MKSHRFNLTSRLRLAWGTLLLLLLSSLPLSFAESQRRHHEVSKYPFQDSLRMASSDSRFYRLDLVNALKDLNLVISVLPKTGSISPKLFVSKHKEFPQTINDKDYSTMTTSRNGIFISSQDLQDTSDFLYIGLVCPNPKCNAQILIGWTKEMDLTYIQKSLTIGESQVDVVLKQSSVYYTLSVPKKENIESVQIQLTKFSGDLDVFVSKSNKTPNKQSHDAVNLSYEGLIIIKDLPDLSGTYYIGIHGLETSHFSLAAAIQTNPHTTEDSAFLLSERKPQKGVLLPKHHHQVQYYKIRLDPDYKRYSYLHITVNSLAGQALIVANHNGEFPTAENHQWEGQNHELKIPSKDLSFKNQSLYIGILIERADSEAHLLADLTYYITYSLINDRSPLYHSQEDLDNEELDSDRNLGHTFVSQNTPFFGAVEEIKYFEALVPYDQFPLTIHQNPDFLKNSLYFSTDPRNKHPTGDFQNWNFSPDGMTLMACEVIKDLACSVYITVIIDFGYTELLSTFSLSISSARENYAITLQNERLFQSKIEKNDLPAARFYYHAIPSKISVISVGSPGMEAVIYAKRIQVNIESQEKPDIEILNEKIAEFTGITSITVPPLVDSEITIVAISVYFKEIPDEWYKSKTFDILVSSQITELSHATPVTGFVDMFHYKYFRVNLPRPDCVLLVSLKDNDHDLVISYGENARPTISDHQFARVSDEKHKIIIEIDQTDISRFSQESMAGSWVIGVYRVYGRYGAHFTLTAIIEDQKIVDLKPWIPVEMMPLQESSFAYFKFHSRVQQNLQINLTKITGQINLYMTSVGPNQDFVLPNQTYHEKCIRGVSSNSMMIFDPQNCIYCVYLIQVEAVLASEFSLVVDYLPSYVAIQDGIEYTGLLKPQESTIFQLRKFINPKDKNQLAIQMKGKELHIMGSESSMINSTNYLWKEILTEINPRNLITLPSEDWPRVVFYLLLENTQDKDVEYRFHMAHIAARRPKVLFGENIERIYDLYPFEEMYFGYHRLYFIIKPKISADVIFYVLRNETQDLQTTMQNDLKEGSRIRAKYWPDPKRYEGSEDILWKAEAEPKFTSNSTHIICQQKFSTKDARRGMLQIVHPWKFKVKFRIFIRDEVHGRKELVDSSSDKKKLSFSESYRFGERGPGYWYFWFYSCREPIDLKVENGDVETGMATVQKENSYFYQGSDAESKEVYLSLSPKSATMAGEFIYHSFLLQHEKKFKSFDLKENNLEVNVTHENIKEDKSEVTVEFKPVELQDPESYDWIQYTVWLCKDSAQFSPICREYDEYGPFGRCKSSNITLEKNETRPAKITFEDIVDGGYFVKIKARIGYQDQWIKDIVPYATAYLNLKRQPQHSKSIMILTTLVIGISSLIFIILRFL